MNSIKHWVEDITDIAEEIFEYYRDHTADAGHKWDKYWFDNEIDSQASYYELTSDEKDELCEIVNVFLIEIGVR